MIVTIDMVLYCPKCGLQHIDTPETIDECRPYPKDRWENPPHRTHLCLNCGHLWRPSDHPTNGVERTASGKDADTNPGPFDGVPLRCVADAGKVDMRIGVNMLKHAAAHHPSFWDGVSDWHEVPCVKITDAVIFAREVAMEINREEEDGSTLLTAMLDKAIERAVENGCEGVDHDVKV